MCLELQQLLGVNEVRTIERFSIRAKCHGNNYSLFCVRATLKGKWDERISSFACGRKPPQTRRTMGTGPLMRPSHAIPCKMLIVTWLFASLIGSTMCRLNVRPPRIHIHSVTPLENRVRESLPPPSTILTHLKDRIQFFHNLLYLILYNC